MKNPIIDLRSDTVTHPTDSMREAMASAEVGDDVYGEDPTINRLEERAAELMGREAAVFVPTGTMGNQIAIHIHTHPGSEVVAEAGSHIFNFEMGAMASLSGALPRAIETNDGILYQFAKQIAGEEISFPPALSSMKYLHKIFKEVLNDFEHELLPVFIHGNYIDEDDAKLMNEMN